MSLKIRLKSLGDRGLKLLSLIILMILLSSFVMQGSAAEESNIKEIDLICHDVKDSQDILKTVKDYSLLQKENETLNEEIQNLKEENSHQSELLRIAEERRKIQEERAEFYKEMYKRQEEMTKKYADLVEKMEKKEQRQKIWDVLKILGACAIGVFIGLAF